MDAQVGKCKLCGQTLVLTDDDCWHPYNVPVGCPPAPEDKAGQEAWVVAGNRYGRPGRENWEPA